MSKILILKLAAPMQSWGASSRFTQRGTEAFPTKSGIVGLLAAAEGRRRSDPIEDLAGLRIAARIDQPGELLRDFHTAHRGGVPMPLSDRFYISDGVFVAFIEGEDNLIDALLHAIQRPKFPLFLGRRACPPALPLLLESRSGTMWSAITELPWQAARFHQRKYKTLETVSLRVVADEGIIPGRIDSTRTIQDVPLSFASERREYGIRNIDEARVDLPNPEYVPVVPSQLSAGISHDPMEVI
ncbi:type I-E CRISPR-associated protein Cas5/CasD [Schaalia cardiffensis]|uniref:type I-E CRISPR-associated protein Cas5/CasD n=1 Tax=Schaalia cardiffensis TaxID=181487 RepID=UPI0023F14152|nr:type I-E CRISPR-associated protein Cas5/CasD [Schaalia cardiffensis]